MRYFTDSPFEKMMMQNPNARKDVTPSSKQKQGKPQQVVKTRGLLFRNELSTEKTNEKRCVLTYNFLGDLALALFRELV